MAYTVIGSQGAVTHPGDGTNQINGSFSASGSFSMQNLPYCTNVITASSAQSFLLPGMYVLSGSGVGNVTASLPDPGRVPGGTYIFRAGSAHAHVLTGTVGGFQCFGTSPGTTTTGVRGSSLTLDSVQNSSVTLTSDGFRYIIAASSGTCILAQS